MSPLIAASTAPGPFVPPGLSTGGGSTGGGSTGGASGSTSVLIPALPNSEPSFGVPSVDRTVNVSNDTELSNAFTDIQPGDEIVLSSTFTYSRINLPSHGGTSTEWAILRGATGFPSTGTRIGASTSVPVVQHDGNLGILNASSVFGWYVYGLKFEPTDDANDGVVVQASSRIVLDRSWVFAPGDPSTSPRIRRGVRINGTNVVVKNSRVEGIIWDGFQTQGVHAWDGAGPFLIENNLIEALNQNFLVGGASPSTLGNNPADGTVRNNHLFMRSTWSGETGTIFHVEFKAGDRWLVEGNVCENDWTDFKVAVKAPESGQGTSGQTTSNLTFRKNRYKGTLEGAGAYSISRKASQPHTVDTEKILLEDEWWDQFDSRSIRLIQALDHVTIRRVTIEGTHSSLELLQEPPDGESPNIEIDRLHSRAGSFGLWVGSTNDDFTAHYPNHFFTDYWQHWNDDGDNNCDRNSGIPGTLSTDAQAEFFCTQFSTDIPDRVGANTTDVTAFISGVEDSNLPGTT